MSELSEHIVSAPVVLLTGAGASVALGKPTTVQFIEQMKEELGAMERDVWPGLVRSCRDIWNTEVVDLEMILEHTRAVLHETQGLKRDYNLAAHVKNAKSILDHYQTIERNLCGRVVTQYADVDPAEAKALYEPLFAGLRAARLETLPIFTLNYDVGIERAAMRLGVPLVDGIRRGGPLISPWSEAEFRTYVPRSQFTVVLFKLHGSTTWARAGDGALVEVPLAAGKDPGSLRHALLYPYLTQKDLEREPFKTGYAYLEACLAKAAWLVIIGTSLRDVRLVQTLRASLAANPHLAVVLLDPAMDEDRFVEKVEQKPWLVNTMKAEFDPDTSRELLRHLPIPLDAKRRRKKARASASPTSLTLTAP